MKTKLFCAIALSVSLRLFAGSSANEEFVAHEWGTFTSVQGADGIQLEWNPLLKTDLPEFVYSRAIRQGGFTSNDRFLDIFTKEMPSFVRMETPVIYFYSDKERTANVRVNFNGGRITEWYPQATRVGPYQTTRKTEQQQAGHSFIEWAGLKILPRNTKEISADKLIRDQNDKAGNHYYAARETDASFLRMASPHARSGVEYERDLFYRGVGFFQAPLTLNLQSEENDLQLSTTNSELPLTDLVVLTIRNGTARYHYVDRVRAGEDRTVKLDSKSFMPLSEAREQLMTEMKAALVKQGLYVKEAQAMVNTWEDQWFTEDGTRVLYLLPRAWTDRTLPLTVKPRPDKIVRVMVGRAELITPTMEWELNKQVVLYSNGSEVAKQQAVAGVRNLGLGRFIEPATRRILGRHPNKEFSQAAWSLAQEASKTADGKAPAVVEKQLGPLTPKTAAVTDVRGLPAYARF